MKPRMLDVNLSEEKTEVRELDDSYFNEWVGGRGLGAKLLSEEKVEDIEPLSEENVLIFSTSPFVGLAPAFNRIWVTTISPLTGYYLCSSAGGFFAGMMRKAGFDVIRVKGKAERPVVLEVSDGKAVLVEAFDLWEKSTDYVREKLKSKGSIACIGEAGEKKVRFASIQFDERSAGRGGAGAVMGSKLLKAVTVNGSLEFPAADSEKAKELMRKLTEKLVKTQASWGEQGTLLISRMVNEADGWPTNNFRQTHFKDAEPLYYEGFKDKIVERRACFNCPIACARYVRHKDGSLHEGPEYETVWAFGPQIGFNDPELVIQANRLCDKHGLDTINTGNIIGWVMELSEKGLIERQVKTKEQVLELITDIAFRQGQLPWDLGEGLKHAAKTIGEEAEKIAIHQQNMCLPAYDPRAFPGMLLTYTLGPRHGCHLKAWTISRELKMPLQERLSGKGKARLVNELMVFRAFVDSASHCSFLDFDEEDYSALFETVLGVTKTMEDFKSVGSKILDLERSIDVRRGLTKEQDTLPYRILNEPVIVNGREFKAAEAFEEMKREFYKLRGW